MASIQMYYGGVSSNVGGWTVFQNEVTLLSGFPPSANNQIEQFLNFLNWEFEALQCAGLPSPPLSHLS